MTATEPRVYAWIVPDRLVVAERVGGGGRSHRRERRQAEEAWWWGRGVRAVVSGMPTRHGLLEHALAGFRVAWEPLTSPERAPQEVLRLAERAVGEMERGDGAVLVHVDRPEEWLAAADAALRCHLGLARGPDEALGQAAGDGLPVGALARTILTGDALRGEPSTPPVGLPSAA